MSIILSGISFHYCNQQPLFECVHLSVSLGAKVSVIGSNGTGKSTLLKLIAGKLNASSGTIQSASTPYYIPQHIGTTGISVSEALHVSDKIEALHAIYAGSDKCAHYDLLADDWEVESRCRVALDAWGLSTVQLTTPIDSLSGGEKTKLLLAGISIHHPNIILLDEPTNHLDDTSRQQLYEFIAHSRATIVTVSHDVALLNVQELTYELSSKGLKRYGGNYDFYHTQREIEREALSNQINAEETALRLARKKATLTKERQEKRANRGAKTTDGIPRIVLKGRQDKGENTGAKLADIHESIIHSSMQKLTDLRQKQKDAGKLRLNFDNTQLHKGKLLVAARHVNFNYEEKGVLWQSTLTVDVWSGERIHLKGGNGSGKTSLLKLFMGELLPSAGRIIKADFSFVYLDQEYRCACTEQTLLELAQQHNDHQLLDHEIKLRLHRALFPKEMWDKPCRTLSGGERMRLCLCCMMISNHTPDLFMLDEPTNNLDLQSLDILTSTIQHYQGTLLVVSHDQRFIEAIGVAKVIEL